MDDVKINYDEDGDILYVSFGRNEHVTGVELAEGLLLRMDTGAADQSGPKAVGLTFVGYKRMLAINQERPFMVPLANLRKLPEDIRGLCLMWLHLLR